MSNECQIPNSRIIILVFDILFNVSFPRKWESRLVPVKTGNYKNLDSCFRRSDRLLNSVIFFGT